MYLQAETRQHWPSLLKHAAWVHNSSKHEALQASPFEVVTGVKPRTAKAWMPAPGMNMRNALKKFASVMGADPKRLEAIREKARIAIAKGQAGYLTRLNRNAKAERYNKGDLVLRKKQYDKSKYPAKWSMRYVGPYTVTEVINPVVMRIRDEQTGWSDLIHTSFLRPYRSPALPPCEDASNFFDGGETTIDFTPYEQLEYDETIEEIEETYDSSDYEPDTAVNWDADTTFASNASSAPPTQTSGLEKPSTPDSRKNVAHDEHDETLVATPCGTSDATMWWMMSMHSATMK
jgi:hypothetical protein